HDSVCNRSSGPHGALHSFPTRRSSDLSEGLRRDFYEAWMTRASDRGPSAGRWDNSAVIEEILKRRHEAARLLDFANYAEYAKSRDRKSTRLNSSHVEISYADFCSKTKT